MALKLNPWTKPGPHPRGQRASDPLVRRFAAGWTRKLFGLFFEENILSDTISEVGPRLAHRQYAQALWRQKVLRMSPHAAAPLGIGTNVSSFENLNFANRAVANLASPGCYYQNFGARINIGRNVYIAPNVGLITANHAADNLAVHSPGAAISIADNCWIGMNSVILPGVALGPGTIVAAGAVVTRSFPEGNVLLAGVPAEIRQRR